jgi:biopolymer transport protein ExbB
MRLFDYVNQGGAIMYILVLLNIIGMSLLLWRVFIIFGFRNNLTAQASAIGEGFSGKSNANNQDVMINLIKDEVSSEIHKLEFGLNTIKIIASISPLLGLLGTVIGILSAFQVIAEKGLSDPSLFAGGISMALITTVGGLIVAIPHFIGHNYLVGLLDDVEIRLEKMVISKIFMGVNGAKKE